ncbi:MAG: ABC transporter ATP-binding protein, partial [Solirubrobacteraceae bacterium]
RQRAALKERIGIVLQSTGVDRYLTVAETIAMYSGYYPHPRPADEVIELVGLTEKRNARVVTLSGGQQRRLDVAIALAGDPDLLFLDEPTTGFDPAARHHAWDVIAGLRELGKTVFLTTHYMDEAEALADRIAVIAGGRIAAAGDLNALRDRGGTGAVVTFDLPHGLKPGDLPVLPHADVRALGRHLELHSTAPTATLAALTGWAAARGLELGGLAVRRPSLEDVYLRLTGER